MPVTGILAGAGISDYQWLKQELSSCDFIICADSGLRHADTVNIIPDIIIGDFDSVDIDLLNKYKSLSNIIHSKDQNTTDLMKALSEVSIEDDIHIYGAVGERADHDFSNYLILLNHHKCNQIILKTPVDERRVINKSIRFPCEIGDIIGVFPLITVNNLSYNGLEYSSENIQGPYSLGWNGSCNPAINSVVEIQIDSGAALITRSYNSHSFEL